MPMSPRLLRPAQSVHPDAADWARRVASNGASVSPATLRAVSAFCKSITANNLRYLFYRLNLFCGTGLNAALVPLYRGPSLGGTQYGNTTDTNVGPFVSGDYAETGASGGLWYGGVGANTSKYLNTGVAGSSLFAGDRHVAAYEIANASTDYSPSVISGTAVASMHAIGTWTSPTQIRYRTHNTVGGAAVATAAPGFWLGSDTSTTASVLYRNGASAATTSGQSAGGSGATNYFILGSPGAEFSEARLGAYSIGLSMTGPQAASYYTAMQAFQTALVRNA